MAAAQVELNDQLQNGTSATLTNQTVASMELIRSVSWSGSFAAPGLPQIIPSRGLARFTHLGAHDLGSKAAVSYASTNAAGLSYAIILAWDAPTIFNPSTSPNKIYGACGPKGLIDTMTWDQIRMALESVGVPAVEINRDGVCMQATILNNPATKMADLLANFSLCPKP